MMMSINGKNVEGAASLAPSGEQKARRPILGRKVIGAAALVLLVLGVPCWVMQLISPQFGEGAVTWGLNIDVFFLTAGIGSALLLLVGLSSLTGAFPAIGERRRILSVVSFGCLLTASWVVFLDAGLPIRVFQIISHAQFGSLFVWDFYFITASGILALVGAFGKRAKALDVLGIVLGLAVLLVEGMVLAVCTGTALWHGNIALLIMFLAEGLVAAMALVLLMAPTAASNKLFVPSMMALLCVILLINVIEVIIGMYLGNGTEALTAHVMVAGSLAPLFWAQIILGIGAPIALLVFRKTSAAGAIAALFVLFGVFMGKFMTLLAGQAVLATGELAAYAPSLIEIGACCGYAGLVLLIAAVGGKLIDRRDRVMPRRVEVSSVEGL